MRGKSLFLIVASAGMLLAMVACGTDENVFDVGGDSLLEDEAPVQLMNVKARYNNQGIDSIEMQGRNIFSTTGGYYIIGGCGGPDDPGQNVISRPSNGRQLHQPGHCPGAPFRLNISGQNPIRVSAEIGPLPVAYGALMLAFDADRDKFTSFRFDTSGGAGYKVGCGATWSPRSAPTNGAWLLFAGIPTPCTIQVINQRVGVARIDHPVRWTEIAGPLGTVRRTLLGGNVRTTGFTNHPGTYNTDFAFSTEPGAYNQLPAGSVWRIEEEIAIFEGTNQAPQPPAPTPSPSPGGGSCSASQPFPHFGMRNGQCLPSCGRLGGTASYNDSCSKHGMVDAGQAYDVANCCRSAGTANPGLPQQPLPSGSAKINFFRATPTTARRGESILFSWSSSGTNLCRTNIAGVGNLPPSGSGSKSTQGVAPGNYTVVMTCQGSGPSASASVNVGVQ